jgi:hypothetical protein
MSGADDVLRQQEQLIEEIGWAVTAVVPDMDDPDEACAFAYTVGLTAHDFPELLVVGLDPGVSQSLLNDLAQRVYDKARVFTHGERISDLLSGYDAVIVDGTAPDDLAPAAAFAHYGQDRVRLQQIVWPDAEGRFPWEDGYAFPPYAQPVIGRP